MNALFACVDRGTHNFAPVGDWAFCTGCGCVLQFTNGYAMIRVPAVIGAEPEGRPIGFKSY